jgi:hypothetical protein
MQTFAAHLEVVAGNAVGMSILIEDELLIGRHGEGAGRLADDDEISRLHARMTLDSSGSFAIEDLGSTNGTFVNGLRITGPQALSEGDTIELGQTKLVVRDLPSAGEEPAPPTPGLQPTVVPAAEHATPPGAPATPSRSPTPEVLQESPAPSGELSPVAPAAPAADDGALAAPASTPMAAAAPMPPPLSLRVDVNFADREARLLVDDTSELVRLVFDGAAWRSAPSAPIEKGGPNGPTRGDA